jgi:hypothetical protein
MPFACERLVNEFQHCKASGGQDGIYLHEVDDRSCGAAGNASQVDITIEVGAQRYLVCVRMVAGPLNQAISVK